MKHTVSNLLNIARAELGYHEKASNAQLDDPKANAGSKNYTKYARDLHAAGYYQANKNGFQWCDMFTDWCFLQLCGGDKAAAEKMQCQTGPYGAGVDWSARYYKAQGRYTDRDPRPGDQVFFGNFGHTGIVEKVENGKIFTIEGNAQNEVRRKVYNLSTAYVKGFGHPYYEPEEDPAPAPAPAPDPKPVPAPFGKKIYGLPTIKYGSRGPSAKALQLLLIGMGYDCGPSKADGIFGSASCSALKKYQADHGLTADVICGPGSWASILGL